MTPVSFPFYLSPNVGMISSEVSDVVFLFSIGSLVSFRTLVFKSDSHCLNLESYVFGTIKVSAIFHG